MPGIGRRARTTSGRSGGRKRLALLLVSSLVLLLALWSAAACGDSDEAGSEDDGASDVVVTTSHLVDIAQNVAGDRLIVEGLMPPGIDPHAFQPTPSQVQTIIDSRVIIVDVFGLAPMVDELIQSTVEAHQVVVEAVAGITPRRADGGDPSDEEEGHDHDVGDVDPHFWLDPVNVITYVENILAAFAQVDPEGAAVYETNAQAYTEQLRALDEWIREQVKQIPVERRLLVTNHESLGYFAERYGLTVVGTVFGSTSVEGAPSARQLASLIEALRSTGAPAIFVETGSNSDLAAQVAREAGVELVTDLYTHSVGEDAPTYIDMIRWDVTRIVEALR